MATMNGSEIKGAFYIALKDYCSRLYPLNPFYLGRFWEVLSWGF